MIFITKTESQEIEQEAKTFPLEAKVGGCCGCFTTNYKAKVTFDKNLYFLGDIAKVHIEIDNSNCKKDVEQLLFALERRHWA